MEAALPLSEEATQDSIVTFRRLVEVRFEQGANATRTLNLQKAFEQRHGVIETIDYGRRNPCGVALTAAPELHHYVPDIEAEDSLELPLGFDHLADRIAQLVNRQ